MNGPCTRATQFDGEHRLEFREEKQGVITWICLDCGEEITQWGDHHGC
jgi:hypothetical protein